MLALLLHLLTAPAGYPPELRSVPTTKQVVSIGVNVVWGTEYVPPIVQALKSQGDKATFFLGGTWAENHPDVARQIRDAGMEIGSHGDRHRHVGSLGITENEQEITRAAERIKAATGVTPTLYGPAYGELSPAVHQAAQRQGVRVVMWSIDTIDWRKSHTPEIIRSRVLTRLQPGAIILMHPTDRTAAALPGLLQELHRRGYRVVGVHKLLQLAGRAAATNEKRGMQEQRVG
ncbi:MAG: polysaccharide deacetylase family protein [Thermaerobacter sp.]|nr:polysaccharide deacetylase family protein [Thermaerobacter sp.]